MQIKSRTYGNVFPLPTRRTIEVVRMVGFPPELDVSSVNDGTEEKKLYQKQEVKISHEDLKYILNLQCSS